MRPRSLLAKRYLWRHAIAQLIWFSYAGLYALASIGAVYAGLAFPFVMAIPLLAAVALFAAVFWARQPRLVTVTAGIALVHLLVAQLLIGGPGTTWSYRGARWENPPGIPAAVRTVVWIIALLVPLALTIHVIRAVRRDATAAPSAG